jgi:hypothetical protein
LKAIGDVVLMAMGKSPYVEELKPCDWIFEADKETVYSFLKSEVDKNATILSVLKKSFKRLNKQSLCYDQLF